MFELVSESCRNDSSKTFEYGTNTPNASQRANQTHMKRIFGGRRE